MRDNSRVKYSLAIARVTRRIRERFARDLLSSPLSSHFFVSDDRIAIFPLFFLLFRIIFFFLFFGPALRLARQRELSVLSYSCFTAWKLPVAKSLIGSASEGTVGRSKARPLFASFFSLLRMGRVSARLRGKRGCDYHFIESDLRALYTNLVTGRGHCEGRAALTPAPASLLQRFSRISSGSA